MKTLPLVFVIFLCSIGNVFAQNHQADSLKMALTNAKQDTEKINTLIRLAGAIEANNPDTAIMLCNQSLAMSRSISWKKGIIYSQYDLGIFYEIKGSVNIALAYEDSALALSEKENIKGKLSSIYNILGNIYSDQNNYSVGLDYYFKSLAIDSLSVSHAIADVCSNIGLDYQEMGNYVKAEDYYFKAQRIYETENNKEGLATVASNLGNLYNLQGDYKKGLESNFAAEQIDSSINNQENLILDYQNIGNEYLPLHNYKKALEYGFKGIYLSEKIGILNNLYSGLSNVGLTFIYIYEADSAAKGFTYTLNNKQIYLSHTALLDSALKYEQISIVYANSVNNKVGLLTATREIGDIFNLRKDYQKAILFYQRAYDLADSINVLQEKMENSRVLGHTFAKVGNYPLAYKYLDNAIRLNDSLFGEEKQKAIGKIEAQFDYDKKFLEQKKEHEKEEAVSAEQEKRQKYVIATVSLGFGVVLIFLTLLFRRYKLTNRQKKIIEEQKKDVDAAYGELNNTHALLQEKDKDITDSIAYARKIQNAILPSGDTLNECLGEGFVLYKPRDVVSGDFYWCHKAGNKSIFAVVDCTGHGVPGAFMSMIGSSILNQVVIENKTYVASDILNEMRANLLKQLQQKGQEAVSRDGMDISLCIWDKDKGTLQYAGANSPLYLVRKNINSSPSTDLKLRAHGSDMLEILPDKQPIGYQEGKMESGFTAQNIKLQKGDYIYISSDGYHDQFGGERNKKFTSRAFRDLLISMNDRPVEQQKQILDGTIETWKATYAQTDDICVMGIKIS